MPRVAEVEASGKHELCPTSWNRALQLVHREPDAGPSRPCSSRGSTPWQPKHSETCMSICSSRARREVLLTTAEYCRLQRAEKRPSCRSG